MEHDGLGWIIVVGKHVMLAGLDMTQDVHRIVKGCYTKSFFGVYQQAQGLQWISRIAFKL